MLLKKKKERNDYLRFDGELIELLDWVVVLTGLKLIWTGSPERSYQSPCKQVYHHQQEICTYTIAKLPIIPSPLSVAHRRFAGDRQKCRSPGRCGPRQRSPKSCATSSLEVTCRCRSVREGHSRVRSDFVCCPAPLGWEVGARRRRPKPLWDLVERSP